MRFYNFLKRKPITQDKKHIEPKQPSERGRWMPGTNTQATLPPRYPRKGTGVIKN